MCCDDGRVVRDRVREQGQVVASLPASAPAASATFLAPVWVDLLVPSQLGLALFHARISMPRGVGGSCACLRARARNGPNLGLSLSLSPRITDGREGEGGRHDVMRVGGDAKPAPRALCARVHILSSLPLSLPHARSVHAPYKPTLRSDTAVSCVPSDDANAGRRRIFARSAYIILSLFPRWPFRLYNAHALLPLPRPLTFAFASRAFSSISIALLMPARRSSLP